MEDDPPKSPGAAVVRAWTSEARSEAALELAAVTNRLWAGNGAGLVSSITLLAAAARDANRAAGGVPAWWLSCPLAFALGLAALGAGSVFSVLRVSRRLTDLEDAEGIFDLKVRSIERPSAAIGAVLKDGRAICSLIATACLMAGVVLGLADVYAAAKLI